ncbi:autophagy-related protein 2 homolog B [Daktulosphaira vitifoliae]|uniref:autophagy-related protein 2 homolog B n=1 Tax=Daktulosphaira vitifoliae TaxID=58002 RepID=UPI0021A9E6FB|nr:autophagy-related protein 2 homolog B [Daktulosphaira vitifoliae]XP_050544500.1 autophagy-related protein 2 homolog B [Daktulosphaira vitifoliae]
MSWFNYCTENLQKRCCRYLLQRYVGRFLEHKIEPDQLSINVLDGSVSLEDIVLDVQALNDVGEENLLPFEFVESSVDKISLSVPWRNMLTDSSIIHIEGLSLTVRPNVKETEGIPSSMLESVWSSMSNSVYSSPDSDYEDTFENTPESEQVSGLEVFTQAIESILNRIKVKFSNTVIKLEYNPAFSKLGIGLQLHIISLEYIDEVADESKEGIVFDSLAFLTKKLMIEGVFLQTYEFKCQSAHNENLISKLLSTEPITIAELTGTQAIRMVLKHNPSLPGPKLSLEIIFGPLNVLLSPRQFYVVLELLKGVSRPLTEKKQCVPVQKPMTESDFNHIELDLLNQIEPKPDTSVGLRGMQGWSYLHDEEEFYPLQGAKKNIFLPSMDSSMTSSMSSVASSRSELSSRHTRHKNKSKHEWLGETNHFNVQLASICIVLLHEDILAVCPETDTVTQCSLNELRKISHQYLMSVQSSDSLKDRDKITKSLNKNHIRVVATKLIVEGDEKTDETYKDVNINIMGSSVEIIEVLIDSSQYDPQYIHLLRFVRDENEFHAKTSNIDQPDFHLNFKHNTKSSRSCYPVSSDIKVHMQEAFSEVDISIINRLSSYIHSPDFKMSKKSSFNIYQPQFNEVIGSVNETSIVCSINFNYLVLKFRFPVPDLRPLSDVNRLPWWKRVLRDDILWLYLTNAEGSFTKLSQQLNSAGYELQCKSVEALFQEANSNIVIPIAKCSGSDNELRTLRIDKKQLPKLVLKLCPVVGNLDKTNASNLSVEHTMISSVYVESSKKPSPFASKKNMRQRNQYSESNESEKKSEDGEIQVVPGSREEIMEFVNITNTSATIFLDINLPCVFVTLPSKHLYETIYNRFTNDLFFWSPSFPTAASCINNLNKLSNLETTRYFSPCKSGIQFESESESEDESPDLYYSCGQSKMNIADPLVKRTTFCLNLNIMHCLFTIVTQSRDRSGRVIPQHYGELQVMFDGLNLYMAAGYENTPRHNFICIQSNKFCLSHENLLVRGNEVITPKEVVSKKNKLLKRTLYQVPLGMDLKERPDIDKTDMLTIVVEISVHNHIKTIRVANEIFGTTLKHVFSIVPQSWYYQLSDFFDVVDYPVAGYESPHVITELHQHFNECLIDYRPLYLPYQCVLTIGNFSLSSNIVARSKASTLHIVSEDVALFISARLSNEENIDLMTNYICVMDLGVFELSLKFCKNSKQANMLTQPETDLKIAINVIHIRTCADSAFALCQLISYIASDGDKVSADLGEADFETIDQEKTISTEHTDSDNNSLSSLIMEAMHEEIDEHKTKNSVDKNLKKKNSLNSNQSAKGVEVFYFPDETNKTVTPLNSKSELLADIDDNFDDNAIEQDFCFVEHEVGSGLMPRENIPEVRMLTNTNVRVINNYFKAPVGKIDMLKSPKEYPIPITRYTLREMTLIWHIYGGTDFGPKTSSSQNELTKHVVIVSESNSCPTSPNTLRPSLSRYYSQTNVNSQQKNSISNKGSTNNSQARTRFCCSILPTSWQAKGGAGRQHHVLMQLQLNKVRFQQETYPPHTKKAKRQVLLIQDFEIRDKLASSNINKFLYLYSSEAMPKQYDANMLVVKAAHVQPDSNSRAQECCIKVSLLPLRLNIDQDSLIFLISFVNQFTTLSKISRNEVGDEKIPLSKSNEPIMSLGNADNTFKTIMPNSLIQLNDEFEEHFGQKETPPVNNSDINVSSIDNKSPVYIRQFVFSPDVTIRLDYEGRHIDFSKGSLAGLLMGLAQLNCSEIKLKRIVYKHGLLGFDKLVTFIMQEWLQDIKKHQLPSLLGGVGPMYSFVRLIQGFRDLVQLPIEQYQKDGRIVRGLQKGANSFTTSTAMAALEIATRIVNLIQRVAETTYDMVNPGPSMRQLRLQESKKKYRSNKRAHPADIREGVASAVMLVKEGIGETAQTLVRVATEEHEIKGTAGMVGGVMRQIPPTALTPIILASQATCNVLQGVRCQLVPDARVEAMQKWRCD